MSLTAGMWTGVSGLLAHGSEMNVIGNNIANVNTVGFKGQRMDFEDFIYQNVYSAQGIAQSGRGVSVGAIMGDFSQGSYESTMSPTDLAIGGEGFFKVSAPGSEDDYYTRAGNFTFDYQGYLVDPHGYALQGWRIDNTEGPKVGTASMGAIIENTTQVQGVGVPVDIRLDTWTVEPKQTTNVSVSGNLAATGGDNANNSSNPFAGLFSIWDGTQPPPNNNTPPISQEQYAHQTTIVVYDEAGGKQELTVYFDQVNADSIDSNTGETYWEYIVTMDPAQDQRKVAVDDGTGNINVVDMSTTPNAGLLMSGTLTFDSAGRLKNQSAYTLLGDKEPKIDPITGIHDAANDPYFYDDPTNPGEYIPKVGSNLDDTSDYWYPAEVSSDGLPMFVANFTGVANAQTAGSPEGDSYFVEFDMGLEAIDLENSWENPSGSLGDLRVDGKILSSVNGFPVTTPAGSAAVESVYADGPSYVYSNPTSIFQAAYDAETGDTAYNDYLAANPGDTAGADAARLSAKAAAGNNAMNARATTIWGADTDTNADRMARITLDDWPYIPSEEYLTNTGGTLTLNDKGRAAYLSMITPPDTSVVPNIPAAINFNANGELMTVKAEVDKLAEMKGTPEKDADALTAYGTSSKVNIVQNGYGYGDLSTISVDRDGIVSGVYSNGVTLPLYQVALYDFLSTQGLSREGGNLFSETRDSGAASLGEPNSNGFGVINSNNIEMSNVDLSREFVLMITTQRGFEANSKVITTTDTMLQTVINLKR